AGVLWRLRCRRRWAQARRYPRRRRAHRIAKRGREFARRLVSPTCPTSRQARRQKRPWRGGGSAEREGGSTHIQKFDIEDERRIRRNHASGSLCSIPERGRDGQRSLSTDLHSSHTLVPTRNHFARAEAERERLIPIA